MKKLLFFLFLFFLSHTNFAQDPHMRDAKTVEEVLAKNNPNQFRAMQNHEHYLVLDKLGSSKRTKKFIGELLSFETTDKLKFTGEITRVADSTFTISYYDNTMSCYQLRTFHLNDVALLYKRIVEPGLNYSFSPLFLVPLVYDWIYLKSPPWKNGRTGEFLAIAGGIEVGRLLIGNRQKMFNKIRLSEKRRLKVFSY